MTYAAVGAERRVVDPILREVLRNRLERIADDMEEAILRTAYSPIVKEGQDASAALFDATGRTIAQAVAIPIHLGCMIPAVQEVCRRWGNGLVVDGDVYVLNDPYGGGSHLPDIITVMPVFGDGSIQAFTATMCHHQDVGGVIAGSLPPAATDLFQEGFRIPPMKLVDAGKPVDAVFELLAANVRIPRVVLGDLRAQLAACSVGARQLTETAAELGWETIRSYTDNLILRSAELTRERIAEIPDGDYGFEDYLDNDGVDPERVAIRARVTIAGSEMRVDFSGSSPAVKGPYNSPLSATLSAVYYVLRVVTGSDIPTNQGCFEPLEVIAPLGTIVNPEFPAPVNARTATVRRITDVMLGCLAQALPGKLPAASCGVLLPIVFGGVDPLTGEVYVTCDSGVGGMGARADQDGIDTIDTDTTNSMCIPAEALELEAPIRVVSWSRWLDSGGPGRWRGGCGEAKVFEVVRGRASATYRSERHTTQPWGVEGGKAAPSSHAFVVRADGTREEVASKATLWLEQGDRLHVFISGGGGYGEPFERPPALVAADVDAGLVSREAAEREYGVVLRENGADEHATSELRASRRPAERSAAFDRGAQTG